MTVFKYIKHKFKMWKSPSYRFAHIDQMTKREWEKSVRDYVRMQEEK